MEHRNTKKKLNTKTSITTPTCQYQDFSDLKTDRKVYKIQKMEERLQIIPQLTLHKDEMCVITSIGITNNNTKQSFKTYINKII